MSRTAFSVYPEGVTPVHSEFHYKEAVVLVLTGPVEARNYNVVFERHDNIVYLHFADASVINSDTAAVITLTGVPVRYRPTTAQNYTHAGQRQVSDIMRAYNFHGIVGISGTMLIQDPQEVNGRIPAGGIVIGETTVIYYLD